MIKKSSEQGFISDTVLTGIAFVFYGGTRLGFNIIVQLVYGSAVVGNYNLVLSTAMLAPLFITSIFNIPLSKFASEARGKGKREEYLFYVGISFWMLLIAAALASLVYFVFSASIAGQFKINAGLFKWGAPVCLFYCVYHFFKQLYYVVNRVKLYTVVEVISSLLFFGGLYICIRNRYDDLLLVPVLVHLVFFSIVSAAVFFRDLKHLGWMRRLGDYKNQLKELFKYSTITGLGTALTSISLHIFTIILGKCADIRSVGHFSLVRTTVEPATYLFRVMTMVNFPKIAYIYGSGEYSRLKRFVRDNFKRFLILCTLLFLPVMALSPVICRFLFKQEVTAGIVVLFALMLATMFLRTVGVFHLNFLSATRYPLIPNLISPAGIFILLPFIPLVFKHYGLAGLGGLILLGEILRSAFIITIGEKKLVEIEKEKG